jgi:hypothetical protein
MRDEVRSGGGVRPGKNQEFGERAKKLKAQEPKSPKVNAERNGP